MLIFKQKAVDNVLSAAFLLITVIRAQSARIIAKAVTRAQCMEGTF